MSGSNTFAARLIPIFVDSLPNEGSKVYPVSIYWAQTFAQPPNGVYNINLTQQYQTNQFTSIQAIFVDNSTVPYSVTLQCNETGFQLKVPAFTQGMYPLLASTSPTFTCVLNYTTDHQSGLVNFNCTTELYFLNTPQNRYQFSLPNYGDAFGNATGITNIGNAANGNPPVAPIEGYYAFWQELLPPAGTNTYYLITSIQLNIGQLGGYSSSPGYFNNEWIICEPPLGTVTNTTAGVDGAPFITRGRLLFAAPTQNESQPIVASVTLNYDPPILCSTPNGSLGFWFSFETPTEGPLADGSGYFQVGYTICYGTVVIE